MLQASKVATSVFGSVLLGVLLSSLGSAGCKKDEPPPPLPSAAPAAVPTPTAPLELAPEEPVAVAGAPAVKATGGAPAQSLSKCCAAMLQNAASAPEPTKTTLTNAAATCTAMVKAGQGAQTIANFLKGFGIPVTCL
ncbi:MAG: acyltransferase [Polyangiaceae bacterium]